MARIRTIKPEFWTDAKTGKLSDFAKCLFIGLLNHTDDYGVLEWAPEEWCIKIFPFKRDVEPRDIANCIVNDMLPVGLLTYFSWSSTEDSSSPRTYIHVVNFDKHQRVSNPSRPLITGWKRGDNPKSYAIRMGLVLDHSVEQNGKNLMEGYCSPHVGLTDGSPQEGKGKEEEGKGKEEPPLTSFGDPLPASADGNGAEAEPIPAKPSEPKPTRGTRLPDNWKPSKTDIAFATVEGFTPAEVLRQSDRFRDYWRSTGAPKKDWPATWRNWIRREADQRKTIRQQKPPGSSGFGGSGSYDDRGEWRDGRV